VLIGMILVPLAGRLGRGSRAASLRAWTIGGCVASALALAAIGIGGLMGPAWPLRASVVALGIANGAFGVAAIGSMMERVSSGAEAREGVRMGIWGAAHAVAFGLGGLLGTISVDAARALLGAPELAYSAVFVGEGLLFAAAALLAVRLDGTAGSPAPGGPGRAYALGAPGMGRDMVGVGRS
jgi:BCD family chlorophyll transporter-like MFS transporter